MIKFLKMLLGIQDLPPQTTTKVVETPMDQGDYHSGPDGYSPNTAYPETQYGSGFDEEAEWNGS